MMRRTVLVMTALVLAGCAVQQKQGPRTQTAIPSAPPRGEPGTYLNMAGAGLTAAFGKPAFVRQDGVIQMWRYDGQACRAFFFLYGAPLAVRHVETLPHGVRDAADSACLTALRISPASASAAVFPP